MDSVTLGRLQCMRFLLKATYEMFSKIEVRNMLDYYSEKFLQDNLLNAKCEIACAIDILERALKNADKQGAN